MTWAGAGLDHVEGGGRSGVEHRREGRRYVPADGSHARQDIIDASYEVIWEGARSALWKEQDAMNDIVSRSKRIAAGWASVARAAIPEYWRLSPESAAGVSPKVP